MQCLIRSVMVIGGNDAGCFKSSTRGLLKSNSGLDEIHRRKCPYYLMFLLFTPHLLNLKQLHSFTFFFKDFI